MPVQELRLIGISRFFSSFYEYYQIMVIIDDCDISFVQFISYLISA